MFFNKISLTWLIVGTVFLIFLLYAIAAYKAPVVAFKAHEKMLQVSDIHNALEENFFVLRDKVGSIQNMINQNLAGGKISLEEIYENASWVDQHVTDIGNQLGDSSDNKFPSLERSLRFLANNNIQSLNSEFHDDYLLAEKEMVDFLNKFQTDFVNKISKILVTNENVIKSAKINTYLIKFNVDFDLLLTTVNDFFKQPANYFSDVKKLLQDQANHINKIKHDKELIRGLSYLEIDKLDLLHKKAYFLTLQYYSNFKELDPQSDTDVVLINSLIYVWEEYDYFLKTQEQKINSIIKSETLESSNQIKRDAELLSQMLLFGAIVISISLLMFFIISHKRLTGLRTAAMNIADGESTPTLIASPQSKDFLSTITRAFNLMIQSLIERDKEVQQYLAELSSHGEKLEQEVQNRTKELSVKNVQLEKEVLLRKQNEDQLKIFALALSNTSEAVVITDSERKIIEINPSFSDLTGYTREEIQGKNPNFYRSGNHDKTFYTEMWKAIEKNGSWSGEIINRRKSGELFPIWETINTVSDKEGNITNYVGVFRDISALKKVEQELHHLAYHDHLTKLPNRSLFHEHLEHEIIVAKRNENKVVVLFIDLDRFKNVNDTLGHQAGDQLLMQVSERLKETLQESDIVSRQGGDEFLILLRGLNVIDKVSVIANKIIYCLKDPFKLNGTEIFIGCSIGISVYPDDGKDVEQLIKFSDTAMYHAKKMGKGRYEFFNEGMNKKNYERIELEQRLSLAIDKESFDLHFQPQINHEGVITGAEALIRWNDDVLGVVSPATFIPIAEENGLIHMIGKQVIEMVCGSIKRFKEKGLSDFPIAINLSPMELLKPDYINDLVETLNLHRINPKGIELEVTETALLENIDEARAVLLKLSEAGFTITLDDFGTGYSSLSYLHQLPFDRLKIDRSFISNIPNDSSSINISKTILSFARSMEMSVVAEGVETLEQQEFLWENKCDFCQGYLISKPLPIDEFIQFSNLHQTR